ncbi:MAG: peptide chain release factor N(5)-glutamine methyltransferase [Candidatus Komeilibacteria bacterium]|nr:peptide chain release factor N(5)-glutamine methyltransferase [Candidatus Komeilibacteria bacterium]
MTIKNALVWATQKLAKNNFISAQLDAEILLSLTLKQNKEFLYAKPEFKLNLLQKIRFFYFTNKRLKNWPIAYLTHHKEFYGYNFYVNKHVLTPRPETEGIIDLAIEEIKKCYMLHATCYTICDIGTGSGCIIITLISELQKNNYNLDNFKFYATDISGAALRVAKKNARLQQVEKHIEFLHGDLLKPLQAKTIDLILANLPYLELTDLNEPSIKKEPKLALLGNYDEFFKQAGVIHGSPLHPKPIIIYEDKTGICLKK